MTWIEWLWTSVGGIAIITFIIQDSIRHNKEYKMNRIKMNGVVYEGNDVSIINGVVKVDGVVQGGKHLETKICEIQVLEGTIGELKTDASVYCQSVTGGIDAGGSVTVQGDVKGDVTSGGSTKCGNVTGFVEADGSVTCGTVGGKVSAGGSVRHG